MNRLLWEVRRVAASLGLPGWVGCALLLAAVLVWWLAIGPMQQETESVRASTTSLQQRLASKASTSAPQVQDARQQLDVFRQRFGDTRTIAAALGRLHAVARKQGLRLEQAEFRFDGNASEPVLRYSMLMPVKCDYHALRRFTRNAMRELPGLAIEEVNMRRSDPKSPTLDAQLRVVLFLSRAD
jgi:Tfp pilus assembly protein PilO